MNRLIIAAILFLAIISGTSRPLLLLSSILIILISLFRSSQFAFITKSSKLNDVNIIFFFAIFIATIFLLPYENIPKFVMVLASCVLSFLVVCNIRFLSRTSQVRVYTIVLLLITLGDLIQLFGILGSDMNLYKSFVQFDELSNYERESELAFFSLRYHGWFAEPSYHGAFVGLLCSQIWTYGERLKSLIFASILFVLCPTPMMFLSLGIGILFANQNFWIYIRQRPLQSGILTIVSITAIVILFFERFSLIYVSIVGVLDGDTVNTSEAIRLVYPIIALSSHLVSYGILPESIECIVSTSCLPESLKFPLVTFVIFFGVGGTVTFVLFVGWLYRENGLRILSALFIASILSGGGGYVLQFGLITALLLIRFPSNISNTLASDMKKKYVSYQ